LIQISQKADEPLKKDSFVKFASKYLPHKYGEGAKREASKQTVVHSPGNHISPGLFEEDSSQGEGTGRPADESSRPMGLLEDASLN